MDYSEILKSLATVVFILNHPIRMDNGVITMGQNTNFEYISLIEIPSTELKLTYLQDVIPQLLNISIEKYSINLFKKFKLELYSILRILYLIQNGDHFKSRLIKTYNQSCNFVQHILAPIETVDNEIALHIYSLIINLPHLNYNFKSRVYQKVISPKLRPRMVPSEKEISRSEFASNPELWEHLISQSNMTEVPRDTIKRCNISKILKSVGVVFRDDMGYVLELQIGDELIKSNDTKIHHWIIEGKRVSENNFRSALNGDYHPAYYRVFKNLIRFHLLVSARIQELICDL